MESRPKNLKITKFQPGNRDASGMPCILGYFIIIMGKRGSGKSTVALDIMYHLKDHVDYAMAISETASVSGALNNVIPPSFIYEQGDTSLLTRIMDQQKELKEKGTPKHMILFIDDVAWDKSFLASKEFQRLAFNGRWYNVTVIMTTQYSKTMPPAIRMNNDIAITMRQQNVITRKAIYEEFYSVVSQKDFEKILAKATKGFSCLVYNNRTRGDRLEEVFFWFEANENHVKNMRIGKPAYWNMRIPTVSSVIQQNTTPSRAEIGDDVGEVTMANADGQTLITRVSSRSPGASSRISRGSHVGHGSRRN